MTFCFLFNLVYSAVWGFLLEVVRDFIWFGKFDDVLAAPTAFIVVDCCSSNGFSPYLTYVEVMLIPLGVIWLFLAGKDMVLNQFQKLYCAFGIFAFQTLLGLTLLMIMLIPLSQWHRPEILNPPQQPTVIAMAIHYSFVVVVSAVSVWLLWRITAAVKKR